VSRPEAILLLGPTGSGKTPLGERIQVRGLTGRACAHFDFGDRLRRITAGRLAVEGLTGADRAFLVEVLERGALLEDEHFAIAETILRAFIEEVWRGRDAHATIVVLNGLPRHAGQAEAVDRIVDIRKVVELSCTPGTVLARLLADTGGDRASRIDDDPDLVRRKLRTYAERTAPLVEHYRRRATAVLCLSVGPETTAEQLRQELTDRWKHA
jgi:adenylate kinase